MHREDLIVSIFVKKGIQIHLSVSLCALERRYSGVGPNVLARGLASTHHVVLRVGSRLFELERITRSFEAISGVLPVGEHLR